jgi:hypothetical protein
MVGLPAIPVIADAFLKGIIDEKDYPLVWKLLRPQPWATTTA